MTRTIDKNALLRTGAQLLRIEAAEWNARRGNTEPVEPDRALRIAQALIAGAEQMETAAAQSGPQPLARQELEDIRTILNTLHVEVHHPGAARSEGVSWEDIERDYDDVHQRLSHMIANT